MFIYGQNEEETTCSELKSLSINPYNCPKSNKNIPYFLNFTTISNETGLETKN